METKLEKLKKAYGSGDYKKALAIASKFPRLGNEKDAIVTAHECIVNPTFYKQLGYDIEARIGAGLYALVRKYDLAV